MIGMLVLVVLSGDPGAYLQKLQSREYQASEEYQRAQAPVLGAAMAAGGLVTLAFALGIIRLRLGRGWKRQLAVRRPAWSHVALAVLGLPGMSLVAEGVVHLFHFLPTFHYQAEVEKLIALWPAWFGVLVLGVGPALSEELWFRGFLGRGLMGRFGLLGGALLTSFFFGLMHLDPPHVMGTMALGLCFNFAYVMTRSLWIPMLLHFLNNSLAVLAASVHEGDRAYEAIQKTPSHWHYLAAAVLCLAVAAAFYRSRARLVAAGPGPVPDRPPSYPGVQTPPAHSGLIIQSGHVSLTAWACVALAVVSLLYCLFWVPGAAL
jgi:membrane protease YdiL (CAAX protease family)